MRVLQTSGLLIRVRGCRGIDVDMKKLTLTNRKGQNIVGVLEKPMAAVRGTCVVQHGWGGTKEKSTV